MPYKRYEKLFNITILTKIISQKKTINFYFKSKFKKQKYCI